MPVDGRMPVVATAKGRRELARRGHVRVAVQDVADLVRILLVHAGERETREAFGGVRVEFRNRIFSGQTKQRQEDKHGRENLHLHILASVL